MASPGVGVTVLRPRVGPPGALMDTGPLTTVAVILEGTDIKSPQGPSAAPGTPSVCSGACQTPGPRSPGAVTGDSLVPWFPSIARRTSSAHRPPKLPEMPLSLGMTASHSLIGTSSPAIFPLLPFTACFHLCRRERTLRTLLCWERSASV